MSNKVKFFIDYGNTVICLNNHPELNEFILPMSDIIEHFKAQIQHNEGLPDTEKYKVEPVVIGINATKFNDLKLKLKGMAGSKTLLRGSKISVRVGNIPAIEIINEDELLEKQK